METAIARYEEVNPETKSMLLLLPRKMPPFFFIAKNM